MKKYQFAAMATAAAMTLSSGDAMASGQGFKSITSGLTESASNVPKLLGVVSYLAGIGLGIAGVLKLKAHVDNAQTPLKEGVVRLAAGGGLLALPTVLEAMSGAVGAGASANNNVVNTFSGVSF